MAENKRIPSLSNLEGIRHNAEKITRAALKEEIDPDDGKKLMSMLVSLHKLHLDGDIEPRLREIERKLNQ